IPSWLRDRMRGGGGAHGSEPILEIRALTRRFGGIVALNDVDLVVPRGAIVGLIGPNGAGKTTLFNVVTGLIRPEGGRITFEGTSLGRLRPNAIVARGIARTFQSIRLFPQMTVLENVLVGEHCRLAASVVGAVLRPRAVVSEEARARQRGRELLTFVGLDGKEDDVARNLPYGDQRRLEIARALATEPRLILLDEPTAGMNPRETETLIGGNGAGKTTTLRTILGTARARRGTVSFNGRRLDTLATDRIVRLGIAQSPEGRRIFPRMTVLENLELGAFARPDRAAIASDLQRVFTLFPRLAERTAQSGGTLSGGEQQMLAIGR